MIRSHQTRALKRSGGGPREKKMLCIGPGEACMSVHCVFRQRDEKFGIREQEESEAGRRSAAGREGIHLR